MYATQNLLSLFDLEIHFRQGTKQTVFFSMLSQILKGCLSFKTSPESFLFGSACVIIFILSLTLQKWVKATYKNVHETNDKKGTPWYKYFSIKPLIQPKSVEYIKLFAHIVDCNMNQYMFKYVIW